MFRVVCMPKKLNGIGGECEKVAEAKTGTRTGGELQILGNPILHNINRLDLHDILLTRDLGIKTLDQHS
jgi:hypothetical protein